MAPLLAAQAWEVKYFSQPTKARTDERLMTAPPPERTISGMAKRQQRNTLFRFTRRILSQESSRDSVKGQNRREVDDRASARAHHLRDGKTTAEEYAFQVHAQNLVPGIFAGFRHGPVTVRAATNSGIVDENVDPIEMPKGSDNKLLRSVRHRDIPGHQLGMSASFSGQPAGGLAGRAVQIIQDQPGAFAGKQLRNRAANALAGTGHNRNLAFESHGQCLRTYKIPRCLQPLGMTGYNSLSATC